jgi:hypothetical protein
MVWRSVGISAWRNSVIKILAPVKREADYGRQRRRSAVTGRREIWSSNMRTGAFRSNWRVRHSVPLDEDSILDEDLWLKF